MILTFISFVLALGRFYFVLKIFKELCFFGFKEGRLWIGLIKRVGGS